jgi:hypothetical protein
MRILLHTGELLPTMRASGMMERSLRATETRRSWNGSVLFAEKDDPDGPRKVGLSGARAPKEN